MKTMCVEKISLRTSAQDEFVDITRPIERIVAQAAQTKGMCYVFVPHTTAGITINENADPAVKRDILYGLGKMVARNDRYQHAEGNSAAHIKASLLGFSVTLFFESKQLMLGTWQNIFLCDFDGPRSGRKVIVQIIGD